MYTRSAEIEGVVTQPALIVFSRGATSKSDTRKNNSQKENKKNRRNGKKRKPESEHTEPTPITGVKDIDGAVSGLVDVVDLSTAHTDNDVSKKEINFILSYIFTIIIITDSRLKYSYDDISKF